MLAKVFNKGQVVIPARIRGKYGTEIGKHVEIIEDKDGIKIVPLGNDIGAKDLAGVFSDYRNKAISEDSIEKATEDYFVNSFKNEIH